MDINAIEKMLVESIQVKDNKKLIKILKNISELDAEDKAEIWKTIFCNHDITTLGEYGDFPDTSYRDPDGNNLLHYAAMSPYSQNVSYLLNKGYDKETENNEGFTPFMIACIFNFDMKVIKALVTKYIRQEKFDEAFIKAAALNDNPEILSYMHFKGCNLEARDSEGYTALLKATRYQINLELIKKLIDLGADLYAETPNGQKCIHLCTYNNNPEVVYFFLRIFDIYEKDSDDKTAMEYAFLETTRSENMEAFLQKQTESNYIAALKNSDNRIINLMVDIQNMDVNYQFSDGLYLLHYAAMHASSADRIYYLLSLGAIAEAEDPENGRNFLHYLACSGNKRIFAVLSKDSRFAALLSRKDIFGYTPEDLLSPVKGSGRND